MDGQKSTSKLMRTQSSLLRSSPTVRSSIQSLSFIVSEDLITTQQQKEEEELLRDEKRKPHRSGSTPRRIGPSRFGSILALISFGFSTIFTISFLLYLRKQEIPASENLLLALIFIAITLFIASKNRTIIGKNLTFFKQLWFDNVKRLGFYHKPEPVQWFIGDSSVKPEKPTEETRVVREGVWFYSNGDFYEGEFYKGKCNGSGVYYFYVNGKYEGDWVNGKYDGYGIENWSKGSKYRGQYKQGLRHGYGVYRFYTGDCYGGEWFNGQSHGVGVQTCSDGSSFMGEFKFGIKHGLGVYHFRNGDRYAGEYFGDRMHGFGVYHFANGHCYEGSWHEGRKQGCGMYTFRSGETRCGVWDGGILKNPLPPLMDAIVRAVQAARRTAENAVRLRRVEEQVNKSVQAANRAATAARVAAIKAVQNRIDGKFCDLNV